MRSRDDRHELERRLDRDFEREPNHPPRRRIPLHVGGALKQHFAGLVQPPVKP